MHVHACCVPEMAHRGRFLGKPHGTHPRHAGDQVEAPSILTTSISYSSLPSEPVPCDVFDALVGGWVANSTGLLHGEGQAQDHRYFTASIIEVSAGYPLQEHRPQTPSCHGPWRR